MFKGNGPSEYRNQ
uniref:Uncharacterized protein n=1 Tax=Rhizophora mucronata TaxID=61149 RepID=A0A2P2PKU1_RHIMU